MKNIAEMKWKGVGKYDQIYPPPALDQIRSKCYPK